MLGAERVSFVVGGWGTDDWAEPTYVSFHSRSDWRFSRLSKVISNWYEALKGAGLLSILTSRRDITDMMFFAAGRGRSRGECNVQGVERRGWRMWWERKRRCCFGLIASLAAATTRWEELERSLDAPNTRHSPVKVKTRLLPCQINHHHHSIYYGPTRASPPP